MGDLNLILLHDQMVDKNNRLITTSLTLIDIHDIARSAKTYGIKNFFVAHPAPTLRELAMTLRTHWDEGYGATYNPNRKEALASLRIVETLDQAIKEIAQESQGATPKLVATSAKGGEGRMGFANFRSQLDESSDNFLLMFGTGWGMSEELLARANIILEPIIGPSDYNHLSVRSACAVILDRICSPAI